MLTIGLIILEIWRALLRPRAIVARKSSFRTKQRELPLHQQPPTPTPTPSPSPQQQQESQLQSPTSEPKPFDATPTTSHQPEQQNIPAGLGDERRRIPVPAKQIVPVLTKSVSAIPKAAPQEPLQQQSQPPSHIPTPVQKSVKTLVLQPSKEPETKMGDDWAKTQIKNFQFGFNQADKDRSGSLSLEEVCAVLTSNGFKGTPEEAKAIFGHMDRDGSNKISKNEFNAAMEGIPKITMKEFVLRRAFKDMDKDGNGRVTKEEIMDAIQKSGGPLIPAERLSDLLIYLSKEDDDGKVRYDEFLRVLGHESTATVMHRIFTSLDADGNGYLSRKEILAAVKADAELKLSVAKVAELEKHLDVDDDKKVSYKEFLNVWLKEKKK